MGANNVRHLLGDLRPAGMRGQPHAIQTTEGSSPGAWALWFLVSAANFQRDMDTWDISRGRRWGIWKRRKKGWERAWEMVACRPIQPQTLCSAILVLTFLGGIWLSLSQAFIWPVSWPLQFLSLYANLIHRTALSSFHNLKTLRTTKDIWSGY